MENPTKQIIYIDASILKQSACFRRLWIKTVLGLSPKGEKEHAMAYGNGIHLFLEHFYKEDCTIKEAAIKATEFYEPFNETLDLNPYEFRTTTNLLKVCVAYAEEFADKSLDFKPNIDGLDKKQVEYKFAIPVYEDDKFIIILCGTIDLICSFVGYDVLLVDHKSTASKAEYFFDQFDWDIQTMLYSKVVKEAMNLDFYPPVMINGIFVKKPTQKAEKEGIFDGVSFKRSGIISYTENKMQEFDGWLMLKINKIISYLQLAFLGNLDVGYQDYDMSYCKGYKLCEAFEICRLEGKFQAEQLKSRFESKIYNPLKFRD